MLKVIGECNVLGQRRVGAKPRQAFCRDFLCKLRALRNHTRREFSGKSRLKSLGPVGFSVNEADRKRIVFDHFKVRAYFIRLTRF